MKIFIAAGIPKLRFAIKACPNANKERIEKIDENHYSVWVAEYFYEY